MILTTPIRAARGFWRRAWDALAWAFDDRDARPRRNRGLAPLVELEDRRLLSAAPITAGNTSQAYTSSATSLTWAHTVAGGSDRILIVGVSEGGDTVTSVTYGGAALTLVGTSERATGVVATSEIWELLSPAVGTANIVINVSGPSTSIVGGGADFEGVRQTTPTSGFAAANGTGGNPAVTAASAAGDLVIGVATAHARTSSSPGTGESQLWMYTVGATANASDAWGAGATATGAASTTISWTTTGTGAGEWAAAALSLLPAGIAVTPTSLTTTQAGGAAGFTLALTSQPTAPVLIDFTNGAPSQGYLSEPAVTFTPSNWNTPQTITVTGLNDNIAAGNQTYQITGVASSTDPNFNHVAMTPVTVTNVQTDVPGIAVNPITVTTSQSGASGSFTVRLNTEPISPVTINLTNGNPAQGSLSTPTLTFDATDWNTPQTVTVTGLNDNIAAGNQTYQITGTATSSDANYSGMAMAPVSVTNVQTDVAGFTVTPTSMQTSMAGTPASFSIALTSAPTAPVTVTLSSSDPSQGTLSQSSLTFTSANWNVAQSVTVTGEDDPFAPGNVSYQINGTATSADANYQGATITPVNVTNVNATAPGIVVTATSLTTTQSGGGATFGVSLATEPTLLGLPLLGLGSVTVNLTIGDPSQGSLSTTSLGFDASNWNVPQFVTVTGLNDNIAAGNQTYPITGVATSLLDTSYNGPTMTPVNVTNVQTDVAGISVTPTSVTTAQAGATGTFAVALTSQPLDPVTIDLTNGNPAQGSLSTAVLTFDASDWNVAQTVTVTGLNNNVAEGNVSYAITGTARSSDANFNGMAMAPVTVTNAGTDVAGFTVTPTALTTSESGTSASFTIALTSAPTAPVTLSLQPTDPTQGSLSQSTLTFDASNWNAPQTVTVTGLDSYMTTPSTAYQIIGSAASADVHYNGQATMPVTVTNDETPNASNATVVASVNPSTYGQSVTFTATVSGAAPMTGTPTGSVTFFDGTTDLGIVNLSGGSASFTTSALAAGNPSITVTYAGDAYFTPDTSAALMQIVNPASLTVSANAQAKIYGQGDPSLTYTATGFQRGDTAAAVLSGALNRAVGENVGSYAINQGTLAADSNYTINFTGNHLVISPAPLTIAANAQAKVYGQTDPSLTYTASGFQFSDTEAAVLTGALSRTVGENVGSYAINQGTLAAGNYTINFTGNHLVISPATLTVAADNLSKVSGQANPVLSDTITGFVNGDAPSVVTGAANLSTPAATNSAAGTYPITAAPGSLNAANYAFAFTNGTLTVTPILSAASPTPNSPPSGTTPFIPTTYIGLFAAPPPSTPTLGPVNPAGPSTGVSSAVSTAANNAVVFTGAQQATHVSDVSPVFGAGAPLPFMLAATNRAIEGFAPIPRLAWQEFGRIQITTLTPAEDEPRFELIPVSRVTTALAAPLRTSLEQAEIVFDVLAETGERIPWTDGTRETTALLGGAGMIATTGYVLLNTRLGLWLLSLLTSQPLWKQLDPLDVLYAWETDAKEPKRDAEDEETLVSMVEEW